MCRKTIINFFRYYCFLFCTQKKIFDCGTKSNKFYHKNNYAGYELLAGIVLGVSMSISFYLYDINFEKLVLWNGTVMLTYSIFFALYHWVKHI